MRHKHKQIIYTMAVLILVLFIVAAAYTIVQKYNELQERKAAPVIAEVDFGSDISSGVFTENVEDTQDNTDKKQEEDQNNKKNDKKDKVEKNIEEEIFTYLQGPKSWSQRRDWSGSWGSEFYDGGSFGAFGCGLCCLANVYSTMSNFYCTPVDMYRFAKRNTEYSGGGAIAWEYMDNILTNLGIQSKLRRKPDNYNEFKKQISEASCSIVLVSSDASRCYWTDTSGHYVTVFLYDKENDMVFLADSGDPSHNRQWVQLRKIYKSLKSASKWQYLCIGDYNKENDTWKHKALNGEWVKPDYIS